MSDPVLANTAHQFAFGDAASMSFISDESVELVVTSPPYPMIGMWDECFALKDKQVANALEAEQGNIAFEAMHQQLDQVWAEVVRTLVPGGMACINIGDATRSLNGVFALYPSHARIMQAFQALGMNCLPLILWRKPTNAPTKFMGSGMLPPGAYVTLEHEYILLFRKGDKRGLTQEKDRQRRRQSAYFWEERNQWFSDLWEFRGAGQHLKGSDARSRSGAFPFELPFRLIHMYSIAGDTILDPFAGTGTTAQAALLTGRNSLSMDVLPEMHSAIQRTFASSTVDQLNHRQLERLRQHMEFVAKRGTDRIKHSSDIYGFPVMTRQEKKLQLFGVNEFSWTSDTEIKASYKPLKADS